MCRGQPIGRNPLSKRVEDSTDEEVTLLGITPEGESVQGSMSLPSVKSRIDGPEAGP